MALTRQMKFQGFIQVPIFLAPYQTGLNSGTAQSTFSSVSDWAMNYPFMRVVQSDGTVNAPYVGSYYDLLMMNPFGLFRATNNASHSMTGNGGRADQVMASLDGNLYLTANQSGIPNFSYIQRAWWMRSYNTSDTMDSVSSTYGTIANNSARGYAGRANLVITTPAPALVTLPVAYSSGFNGLNQVNLAMNSPTLGISFNNMPYAQGGAYGNGGGQMLISPRRNDISNDILYGSTSNNFLAYSNSSYAYNGTSIVTSSEVDTLLQVDAGVSSAFQTAFNSLSGILFDQISRAPNGFLVTLNFGRFSPPPYHRLMLLDNTCSRYWIIVPINQSVPLNPGQSFIESSVQNAKIDATGVLYVTSSNFANSSNGVVGHSYGFNLPWYPIAVPQVPAFSLPCPPPCVDKR